jgi:hypothetical protein
MYCPFFRIICTSKVLKRTVQPYSAFSVENAEYGWKWLKMLEDNLAGLYMYLYSLLHIYVL